jgi:hypothetical protein
MQRRTVGFNHFVAVYTVATLSSPAKFCPEHDTRTRGTRVILCLCCHPL